MAFKSIHRGARISPTKARLVADMIRGLPADEALAVLQVSKRRAAVLIRKILDSAMANADQKDVDPRQLVVIDARVDSGPTMKRWQPKDRGRAHPIAKRTSHITVEVAPLL
ncbi:MAG: 50S ribosomal protein L22 [Phycisphaeraceae bacterium]|nr:50S ribosomal protein L22 [Phycisphaeraceae bacterium]